MLFIRPEWVDRLFEGEVDYRLPFLLSKETNMKSKLLMAQCFNALKNRDNPIEIETTLVLLCQSIYKGPDPEMEHEAKWGGCGWKRPAQLVQEYLHEHFAERITLEQLESVSGISRYHLIHLFKKQNNIPPHAFQNLLRIHYAKKQLSNGKSIAEIAVEAGFYDQSHFTKAFTRHVGVTPQKYRNGL